jgi:hypothetical protein
MLPAKGRHLSRPSLRLAGQEVSWRLGLFMQSVRFQAFECPLSIGIGEQAGELLAEHVGFDGEV